LYDFLKEKGGKEGKILLILKLGSSGERRKPSLLWRNSFLKKNLLCQREAKKQEKNISLQPGLPDLSLYMIPKQEKMYQMNTKCTK
jgi:hypothetical protein